MGSGDVGELPRPEHVPVLEGLLQAPRGRVELLLGLLQRRTELLGVGTRRIVEIDHLLGERLVVQGVDHEAAARLGLETGTVTVFTGSHSHGQGHQTTVAQIASTYLGVPWENIEVVEGDTGNSQFGMGTYGSRSASVGGSRNKFPEKTVALFFYRCTLRGQPRPLLGQEMRWVPREDLAALEFPPADAVSAGGTTRRLVER